MEVVIFNSEKHSQDLPELCYTSQKRMEVVIFKRTEIKLRYYDEHRKAIQNLRTFAQLPIADLVEPHGSGSLSG
jgi:hypothetical protein